jgi:hypothetical protein
LESPISAAGNDQTEPHAEQPQAACDGPLAARDAWFAALAPTKTDAIAQKTKPSAPSADVERTGQEVCDPVVDARDVRQETPTAAMVDQVATMPQSKHVWAMAGGGTTSIMTSLAKSKMAAL